MALRRIIIPTLAIFGILLTIVANAQKSVAPTSQNVIIERHDNLICYYPQFSRIDLVTETMPAKSDKEVIFVCEAAFTGVLLNEFKHSNIAGHHVCSGKFYEGFHCGPNNGVFTWSKTGGCHFYNNGHKNSVTPLKAAAAAGGCGFCQNLILFNGKEFTGCFKPESRNQYRALCDIGGKLCIVDCAVPITYADFKAGLKKIGAKTALYCDMGRGWNYSWYRKDDGSVKEIFSIPGKYTTNWLTFYK